MQLGEEIFLFDWFRLHFVENEGMAFGMSLGPKWGKLLLSLLRIVLISVLTWYIVKIVKKNEASKLQIAALSLILAGAIGNLIDSALYGLIFTDSYFRVAELTSFGQGNAPFLFGKVVDMFYFPLFKIGNFTFFDPVFNIADSAITTGFILFFLSQIKISRKVAKQ
jgi:signal peptidase II